MEAHMRNITVKTTAWNADNEPTITFYSLPEDVADALSRYVDGDVGINTLPLPWWDWMRQVAIAIHTSPDGQEHRSLLVVRLLAAHGEEFLIRPKMEFSANDF